MSKVCKLCHNEFIKIFKKASVLVLLVLMVLGIFGIGGLMKFSVSMMNQDFYSYYDPSYSNQQQMKEYKSQLETNEKEIAALGETRGQEYEDLVNDYFSNMRQYTYYQYLEDLDESTISGSMFLSSALSTLTDAKAQKAVIENYPDSQIAQSAKLEDVDKQITGYASVIKNRDYAAYIALELERVDSYQIDDFEKSVQREELELRLKADPKGEDNGAELSSTLNVVSSYKRALHTNMEQQGDSYIPLTADKRQQLEDGLAVAEYKLNNGYINLSSASSMSKLALDGMTQVGTFFVIIMVLILAGSAVSQEITSGSIKSLIISPTKRWKIFLSKMISLTAVGLAMMLVAYLVSILASLILFGEVATSPYIYMAGGAAHILSPFIHGLLRTLVSFITVFVLMCFAYMLSIITRNTAASVAISIGVYFAGSLATQFLALLGLKGEWLKFIPFYNIDLLNRVFPNTEANLLVSDAGISLSVNPTLGFSICYLVVLLGCILYTAYDSFTRRDI